MRYGRSNTLILPNPCLIQPPSKNPHLHQNQPITKQINNLNQLPPTKQKTQNDYQFINRYSDLLVKIKNIKKNHHLSPLSQSIIKAKHIFSKMTLIQKLNQISHILKNVQSLCKTYGYFSITQAMLQFTFDQPIKITVWIHPNLSTTKPLHPIKKPSQFQCQLTCVSQLKTLIKTLFPTINLGYSKTFINILAYINQIINQQQSKSKHQLFSFNKYSKYHCYPTQNSLFGSLKTMPQLFFRKTQQQLQQQNYRKLFINNPIHKQTTSTLLQSVKSANSITENIQTVNNVVSIQPQTYPIKQKIKKQKSAFLHPKQATNFTPYKSTYHSTSKLQVDTAPKKPTQKSPTTQPSHNPQPHISPPTNYLSIKSQNLKKKLLSTSIQIQSQVNNLFGSTDNLLGDNNNNNYYSKGHDLQGPRNSMLSKVAEEFQDIF